MFSSTVLTYCYDCYTHFACLAVGVTVGVAVGSFFGGVLLTAVITGCVCMAVFWRAVAKKELSITKQEAQFRYICKLLLCMSSL